MKRFIVAAMCLLAVMGVAAQTTWSEPQVPGEDLANLRSTEIVYIYNVDADAFVMYGMNSNMQACAARLTNGNSVATIPNQSYVFTDNGVVKMRNKEKGNSKYISCQSVNNNDVVINNTVNADFAYTETAQGSGVYTLRN